MEEILKIENLFLKYEEKQVIDNLSFNVKKGEYIGVAGKNGSGKSTLGRLLVGLEIADSGKIYFRDREYKFKDMSSIRESVSLVFQNPNNQIIGNTVIDDLAFSLENRGVSRENIKERIEWMAKKLEIEHLLDKNPSELSGGQKQMISIAGVLIFNPEILILDEVTSMLDINSKKIVRDILRKIKNDHTIIHITHDPDELLETERVILLENGSLKLDMHPEQIFSNDELCKIYKIEKPFIYEIKQALEVISNNDGSVQRWLGKLK